MKRRLLLSYLGLTFVLLLVLEVPLAINYGDRLRAELSANLVRDGFALAGFSEETVEGTAHADLRELVDRYAQRSGGRVIIVGNDGRVLADSSGNGLDDDFSSRPEVDAALRGDVATGTRHSDTLNTELLFAAVPIASGGQVHGAVRITYATEQINERWRSYLVTLLAIGAVSMAAAALLGVLFARWVSRPLQDLETASTELGAGHLDVRAPVADGPPEVQRLAVTFNLMAFQLEELVHAQEAFVADASHQLRSPLAALRLQIENLHSDLEHADDFDTSDREDRRRARTDARAAIDAALSETERLSRLVDGLLALARADRGLAGAPRALSAIDVLEDRRAAWEPFATEQQLAFVTDGHDAVVTATEDRLVQALDNLIANAMDASTPGSTITLRVVIPPPGSAGDDELVELHVVDEGVGMSADEREHAFDRFWRGRPTSAGLGGSGLGLAIARKLVRADRGDIELREASGRGVDAVVLLPRS